MKKIKTFNQLVKLVQEAPVPGAGPGPGGRTAPTPAAGVATPGIPRSTSLLGKLGRAASTAGKVISKFDPAALTQQVNKIYNQGAFKTATDVISKTGEMLTDKAQKQINDFFFKQDLPTGWPKVNDPVLYIGIRNKSLSGFIQKVTKVGENLTVTIKFPLSTTQPANRVATAVHNPKQRPFNSIETWYMQIFDPSKGWINEQEETGHVPAFYWDTTKNIFVYDTDKRGKPPLISVLASTVSPALRAKDSILRNITDTFGDTYRGGKVVKIQNIGGTDILYVDTAGF